jgi:hypothetical protein
MLCMSTRTIQYPSSRYMLTPSHPLSFSSLSVSVVPQSPLSPDASGRISSNEQPPYEPQHQHCPNNHPSELEYGDLIPTRRHTSQSARRTLQIRAHRGKCTRLYPVSFYPLAGPPLSQRPGLGKGEPTVSSITS